MEPRTKQNVIPYQLLMDFANETVTAENWEKILEKFERMPGGKNLWKSYKRLGGPMELEFGGKAITGPDPLIGVQTELRDDLARLTDCPREQNISWLFDKINNTPAIFGPNSERPAPLIIPMELVIRRRSNERTSRTDPAVLVPAISDLRLWVYWRLANLWVDGLLSRIGRCQHQTCQRFFLAKTNAKKQYCSQACAQAPTAKERAEASRRRRILWESVRDDLEAKLKSAVTLHQTTERQALEKLERSRTKAQQAFVKAYPRQKGPGYEDGQKLLARASDHVKRLRKNLRGY
jgi:hypothetical protein